MQTKRSFALMVVLVLALQAAAPRAQQPPVSPADSGGVVLRPTAHPRLPADLAQLWMAPGPSGPGRGTRAAAMNGLAAAVQLEADANFDGALSLLSQPAVQQGPLAHYATYYRGLAELGLNRPAAARLTFQTLLKDEPIGYLTEASALRQAESDEALSDPRGAVEIYERLSNARTTTPDDVLMRLGTAAQAAGETEKATQAFARVVYEFPFSDLSAPASAALEHLPIGPIAPGTNRYTLELGRAERLFGAKRYAPARAAFDEIGRAHV